MGKILSITGITLLAIIALCVNMIVNLSSDLAVEQSKAKDIIKLQSDHKKAIRNAKSDCDKKVKKAVEHERNRQNVETSINNPDSGLVNIGL